MTLIELTGNMPGLNAAMRKWIRSLAPERPALDQFVGLAFLGRQKRLEFGRRGWVRDPAELAQPVLYVGILQCSVQGLVQRIDDTGWSPRRRQQAGHRRH